MAKDLCVSSDSHVVEPPELFEPLAKRFGEQAPRVVFTEDRGHVLDLGNGKLGLAIGNFFAAGNDVAAEEMRALVRRGYEIARPGVYDISARLEDQGIDGVDAEILYPSVLFNVYQIENLEIVKATFAAYNDWTADYAKQAPDRLFPLACIQLHDLDAAISEMERSKKLGHVGLCIPATAPPERPYHDRFYDKFWAAAEEAGMPLTLHINTGATANHGLPAWGLGLGYALASTGIAISIGHLILGGVGERFPNIRFVPTEFETGWLSHFLQRLDWTHYRFGGGRENNLTMTPSQYWRRNFRITFEDDEIGIRTRDVSGVGTLMWGSDYPHGDSVFPNSQKVIDEIMRDCTREERLRITAGNVVELYDLPVTV
jgi:predicted TIM-barrel fold metal-dependent hydrolase